MNGAFAYPCQFCSKIVRGVSHRAPGKYAVGRAMMEQYVCKDCQDVRIEIVSGYWKQSKDNGPGSCSKCGKGMVPQDTHLAHRELKKDGSWRVMAVCPDCFDRFADGCTQQ